MNIGFLRWFIVLGLALLLGSHLLPSPVVALDASEMFQDPKQEERARDIGRQLRCMVCQNQSIFDSNSGLAKDLRVLVRERMQAGDSDSEVVGYIADRYGDYVLLEPRLLAKNAILWATPLLGLALGMMLIYRYLRRKNLEPVPTDKDDVARAKAQAILKETVE